MENAESDKGRCSANLVVSAVVGDARPGHGFGAGAGTIAGTDLGLRMAWMHVAGRIAAFAARARACMEELEGSRRRATRLLTDDGPWPVSAVFYNHHSVL